MNDFTIMTEIFFFYSILMNFSILKVKFARQSTAAAGANSENNLYYQHQN